MSTSPLVHGTLGDEQLIDELAAYRRRVAGSYKPLLPADIGSLAAGRMRVSEKIDGALWFLHAGAEAAILANASGRTISAGLALLAASAKLPQGAVVAGELHARVDGRRARVGDLAAALGAGGDAGSLCFTAFDLVRDPAGALPATYDERHARLAALLPQAEGLAIVADEVLATAADIRQRFDECVATGEAEGLIIRCEGGLIYKLKPSIDLDCAIIGYTVKSDDAAKVRSILLGVMREDGRMQVLGGCGNVGSDESRVALMERLSALRTDSAARYASDTGALYTFVRPELVAQIRVTDLQAELSDGTAAASLLLSHGADGWTSHGMRPTPRLIHPVLEGLRADKAVNEVDVRFAQVSAYLPTPEDTSASGDMAASTLCRREVWTKETKGVVAVRKLLVWQTNKEGAGRNFPAFVVHWTDYSPGRATPLDRDIRPAPSAEEATRLADALVEQNIKKGWVKVGE